MRLATTVTFLAAAVLVSPLPAARAQQIGPHAGVMQAVAADRQFRIGAFRRFDAIFPNRLIRRAGRAAQLPRAERQLEVTYTVDGRQHPLSDILDATKIIPE